MPYVICFLFGILVALLAMWRCALYILDQPDFWVTMMQKWHDQTPRFFGHVVTAISSVRLPGGAHIHFTIHGSPHEEGKDVHGP